ncbi:MAG: helix-turn-helix transcriptional regulator [Kiritimatiellae bacterium]|nr:helix-turn-helix transcriptional regulator [Kiritimatiellia bacterium]
MEPVDIAFNIKETRKTKGMTLNALARAAGVTKGYISQVENFRTMPSVATLCKIAAALGVEPGALLKSRRQMKPYVVTRAGAGVRVEREAPACGFVYTALAHEKSAKRMEPFLLEMPPRSTRRNVVTNGEQFVYVTAGKVDFVLEHETVTLRAGDSLYFDGSIPHHPENNTGRKAALIVLYAIGSE